MRIDPRFNQNIYKPLNPQKYIGKKQPFYRSSYEKRAMYFFDTNVNVLKWASELITIPYYFTIDNKYHNYITDFYAEIKETNGSIKKYIFEVKPMDQLPDAIIKEPKKKTQKSMHNYAYKKIMQEKNKCKWEYAIQYCKKHDMEFIVVTEKDLFNL